MKSMLKSLFLLASAASFLAACSAPMPSGLRSPQTNLGSFSKPTASGPARSNAVLDMAYKRFRIVSFNWEDRNHDSKITPIEAGFELSNHFAAFDADKDGFISQKEYVEFDGQQFPWLATRENLRAQARYTWNYLDRDHNGYLMLEQELLIFFTNCSPEMSAYCQFAKQQLITQFYLSDKNHDNRMNFSEYEDMVNLMDLGNAESQHPELQPNPAR